jgi:hypothetical protein
LTVLILENTSEQHFKEDSLKVDVKRQKEILEGISGDDEHGDAQITIGL